MAKPIAGYKAVPELIDLRPHEALTIEARRGTEARVLVGEVWITQTGDSSDYVVPAGSRFCSGHDGRIVVSALRIPSRVSVSWCAPQAGEFARSGVWLDYSWIEQIEREARRARSEELARLARSAWHRLARAWRWVTRQRRAVSRLAGR